MDAGLAVASTTDNGDRHTSTTVVTVDGLTKVQVLNGPLININVVGSITFEVTFDERRPGAQGRAEAADAEAQDEAARAEAQAAKRSA